MALRQGLEQTGNCYVKKQDQSIREMSDWEKCYFGDKKNGKAHGRGGIHYTDDRGKGVLYIGEWQNGKKHGLGTLIYSEDGEIYKCEWRDDRIICRVADTGEEYDQCLKDLITAYSKIHKHEDIQKRLDMIRKATPILTRMIEYLLYDLPDILYDLSVPEHEQVIFPKEIDFRLRQLEMAGETLTRMIDILKNTEFVAWEELDDDD